MAARNLPISRSKRLSMCKPSDTQLLLHLARGIFGEQNNLEKLVQKIMLDAQDLLKCEKCSVYLLEDSFENGPSTTSTSTSRERTEPRNPKEVSFTKVFDLYAKDRDNIRIPSEKEVAKSKNAEIAQYVVIKGTAVNILDLEIDGRFGKGPFVEADGFHTRSVLCMPVFNSDKKIIGVTQLMNKSNGMPFNENDENIIEAFSIFTGLGIHNCQMYENACRLMAKQTVALEVLSYHATAQKEEADKLVHCTLPTAAEMKLYSFDFDDIVLDDEDTLKAVIRMFQDADIITTFKVPYQVICRWACSVKKNYRPVTYHNWRHAFNVCQTMFTMMFTGQLRPLFESLEVFGLMVACLCHDLDHRGTNNAFQVKVASPLAMLYSTSVLEHHHFDHSIMILNSEGNNIFQSLSPEEYRRAIGVLEHAILSTDLAIYFKKRGDFKVLIEEGEKEFSQPYKKDLLKAMMMTACDVAAITKPWEIQQKVAHLVAGEFFEQGDIEKTQLGEKPLPMMDRDKKDELPKMQVGFIDAICMPVYKLFATLTNKLEPLYEGCENNRQNWQGLSAAGEASEKATKTDSDQNKGALENSHIPESTENVTSQPPAQNGKSKDIACNTKGITSQRSMLRQNGAPPNTAQSAQDRSKKSTSSEQPLSPPLKTKPQFKSPAKTMQKQDSSLCLASSQKDSKKQKSGLCVLS